MDYTEINLTLLTFDQVGNTFFIDLREDSKQKIAGTYYDIIPYFVGVLSTYRPYISIIQIGENNNYH